ncbi:MAG: UDP-4-amino-4,6-dideoxy-N-acetyl-beta-L-altrosamine transaminase [Alicyclobacillus sp. RIFOXYA1_FULL_53_8]|nr:MAG: UDP-4-amino-4,6-dideoxy-N-acetyl-beta-L-altrosamine transaminase [Alicyclobacillus sp. RIFOXYA1_FULL_53_8]
MSRQNKQGTPALLGGEPVRQNLLPYSRQSISDADCQAVLRVLRTDYLTTGPTIAQFEAAVANYVGAKYAVAFSNGTSALHTACQAIDLRPGDEVITTPLTFAATANAVLYTGARPVFADISAHTYNLDPLSLSAHITARTRAILPVDFAGRPVDHDKIRHIAKQHGLIVIEDAAHALGSSYHGKKVGALADLTMFSFHPVKAITTGEGGIITTDQTALYERLLQFRSHGITRDPAKCQRYEGDWYYEMQCLGFNYRMTDLQAALGISQMHRLDSFLTRRREIAGLYHAAFQGMEALITPPRDDEVQSGWHLYVIQFVPQLVSANRKTIFDALRAENIGVNVHYIPVYKHPYYRDLGYVAGLCPIAERTYETMLTLPLFPAMTDHDVDDVIAAVRKVFNYYRVPG